MSAARLFHSIKPKSHGGINVGVYANWDVDAAIKYLTPAASGRWGPVRFLDGKKVARPDFVLILNSPNQDVLEVTAPPERIWFASGEPPEFTAYHLGQGHGTVVVTCDLSVAASSTFDRTFILEPPVLRTWHVQRSVEQLAAIRSVKKTKLLSWVTSDKDMLPGHQLRLFFLRAIWQRLPLDLYGRGFIPLIDKWDGIAPYRYSIAFENARSPHYCSEKIMDCFVGLTLPHRSEGMISRILSIVRGSEADNAFARLAGHLRLRRLAHTPNTDAQSRFVMGPTLTEVVEQTSR